MAASSQDDADLGPSFEKLFEAVLRFGRTLLVELTEEETVHRFLSVLREVFPDRYFVVRLVDLRGDGKVCVYAGGDQVRADLALTRLSLKASAIEKTQIKVAVAASALLRVNPRWDSPFRDTAAGFALPLAYAGELYGVLDVGYPLGQDHSEADEAKILPLANQLASALRNERLYRDTKSLRDYQARLIEHASALILGIDSNWRIRVCNRALCDLTGVQSSQLIGRDVRDHFPVVDPKTIVQIFDEGMQGNGAAVGETRVVSRAGRHVPVVWRVASIRSRGAVEAVVAVGQDQTVLSELQKQLVQAEKMSTLGQIAAGVVHELNNPLTAIGVYSQHLLGRAEKRAGSGDEEHLDELDKLQTIRSGAERIKLFTQELIQYAKPSAGVPQRLSINKVINQSLSFCEHLFKETGVALECALDVSLPDVHVVPGQIEQVVINLVTNAVQACGTRGSVRVCSYAEGDSRVIFSVKDEGPGISDEDQIRIFEPFFTTKSDGEGTGLGLCIVRNILEENSGELTLTSALGAGAEFRCAVPAFVDPGDL